MKKLSETKFQHVGNIPKKETLVGCMIHVLAISFRTREQAEMEDRAGQIHKKHDWIIKETEWGKNEDGYGKQQSQRDMGEREDIIFM